MIQIVLMMVAVWGASPSEDDLDLFLRGDANRDDRVNIIDAIVIINYLYGQGGREILCPDAADANDDGGVNIKDPIYLLKYIFGSGNPPPKPFPWKGRDPTVDGIECSSYV